MNDSGITNAGTITIVDDTVSGVQADLVNGCGHPFIRPAHVIGVIKQSMAGTCTFDISFFADFEAHHDIFVTPRS